MKYGVDVLNISKNEYPLSNDYTQYFCLSCKSV